MPKVGCMSLTFCSCISTAPENQERRSAPEKCGSTTKTLTTSQKHEGSLVPISSNIQYYPNIQISEWCLCGSCPSRHISISLAPGTRCQLVELAMEPAVIVKAPHLPLPQLAAAPLQLPMQAVPGGIWTMSSDFR